MLEQPPRVLHVQSRKRFTVRADRWHFYHRALRGFHSWFRVYLEQEQNEGFWVATASTGVQVAGRFIVRFSAHPGLVAAQGLTMLEERGDQLPSDALTLVAWCDADFVDEQLGGFVRVNVMHARGHADHECALECDGEVVARVVQEGCCEVWLNILVEDFGGNVGQDRGFVGSEHPDDWGVFHGCPVVAWRSWLEVVARGFGARGCTVSVFDGVWSPRFSVFLVEV
jgi:hypothetical protein